MAGGGGISPNMTLKRSSQSGTKVMTVAWQTVFTDNDNQSYLFGGSNFDLSTMVAGDNIDIRISKKLSSTGAWVVHDLENYLDAQPTNHMNVKSGSIPDTYGIRVEMRQTAGVLRTIPCEFFVAKF